LSTAKPTSSHRHHNVLAALASDDFLAAVDADIAEACSLGITGVPFYLFGHTHGVSGAQTPDTFTAL
jgi:predicted DsbA family dithiol-disulfide isomerase